MDKKITLSQEARAEIAKIFGYKVEDKITGFKGTVIAMSIYLNGCIQLHVDPTINDKGEMAKPNWIDEGQLKVVGRKLSLIEVPKSKKSPGGGIRRHPDGQR